MGSLIESQEYADASVQQQLTALQSTSVAVRYSAHCSFISCHRDYSASFGPLVINKLAFQELLVYWLDAAVAAVAYGVGVAVASGSEVASAVASGVGVSVVSGTGVSVADSVGVTSGGAGTTGTFSVFSVAQ